MRPPSQSRLATLSAVLCIPIFDATPRDKHMAQNVRKTCAKHRANDRNVLIKRRIMALTLPPTVTPRAFARISEINAASGEDKALRVAVEGGGCSGFQYEITLDAPTGDDVRLEGDGAMVVVDPVSLPFLENAVIDFSEELIGARFVIENPNATASCGCGTSFSM